MPGARSTYPVGGCRIRRSWPTWCATRWHWTAAAAARRGVRAGVADAGAGAVFAAAVGVDADPGWCRRPRRQAAGRRRRQRPVAADAGRGTSGRARHLRRGHVRASRSLDGSRRSSRGGSKAHAAGRRCLGRMCLRPRIKGCRGRPVPHPRPPWDAIKELTARYLGSTPRAGRGTLPHGTRSGERSRDARGRIRRPQRIEVRRGERSTRTADAMVPPVLAVGLGAALFADRLGRSRRTAAAAGRDVPTAGVPRAIARGRADDPALSCARVGWPRSGECDH